TFTVSLPSPPAITSPLTATGTTGTAFSYAIAASNAPTGFSATGLPAGLSFNTATISGTPTQTGAFNVILGATNSGGTGTATLVLTINARPAITTQPTAQTVIAGQTVTFT